MSRRPHWYLQPRHSLPSKVILSPIHWQAKAILMVVQHLAASGVGVSPQAAMLYPALAHGYETRSGISPTNRQTLIRLFPGFCQQKREMLQGTNPHNPHNPHNLHTSLCLSVSLSLPTYLPIYLSTYLPTCLSTYLPTYLSTCLPIYLSTYLPIYLSIYPSIYPSIHPSIYPSIHLSICPSVYLPYLPTYLPAYLPTYLT